MWGGHTLNIVIGKIGLVITISDYQSNYLTRFQGQVITSMKCGCERERGKRALETASA